jgi:hypothetical protein
MEVAITSINEPTTYDTNSRIKSVGFFLDKRWKDKTWPSRERKIPNVGPAF